MKKGTVKRRILITNAFIIIVTLVSIVFVNLGVAKIYWEVIEKDWKSRIETLADAATVERMLKEWTIHQQSFYFLIALDIVLCVAALVVVSMFFTRTLTKHIMQPLNELERGVKRIKDNDLTVSIDYQGDQEFEEICDTFNDMQQHILSEQEKNRKYEQARTEMIAGISHDLRTPLTAVRGTIKGLIDGIAKTDEQRTRFLETAYRRTGDMDTLLRQLFYVSKLETGNMPLHMQELDLCTFISNYVECKKEVTDEKGIELSTDMEELYNKVNVDPEQLHRIFDNLIENSEKYAETDELKINIRVRTEGNCVNICVKDNGCGVPEDKLEAVFEEFCRCDESRNKKEGNGLGLYIVKYLMEAMGGTVRAENDNGFAVYLKLPVVKGE